MPEFDLDRLVDEFREEARDQMDRVDAVLLELEREGELGDDTRSDLLRTLHTLKGNAGMLGLAAIRDFVHAMENVLKEGHGDRSEGVVERLFEGAAALRAATDAAGGERQEEAFAALSGARHRLEELEARPGPTEAAPSTEEPAAAPPTGDLVRVPFTKLDGLLAEVGELLGDARALENELERADQDRELLDLADGLRRRADTLRDAVMSLRLVPLGRVLGRFHGLVRRLARQQDKEARLVVEGEATEMDKSTADALSEPLLHLVRNAIDHGIQRPDARRAAGKPPHGTIRIRARQLGDRVRIDVEDDGAGLDVQGIRTAAIEAGLLAPDADPGEEQLTDLIFEPGFSTRSDVSTVSGQGVGLDVVARSLRELRGDLAVERPEGGGTRFVLRLPLTVAIVPSLVFEAAGEVLALPTAYVERTVRVGDTERLGAAEVLRSDGDLHPVADPDRLFGWEPAERGPFGVVVRRGGRTVVLTAERVIEQRDLVVKAMPSYGQSTAVVSGASVQSGGRVVLVLDPGAVLRLSDESGRRGRHATLA